MLIVPGLRPNFRNLGEFHPGDSQKEMWQAMKLFNFLGYGNVYEIIMCYEAVMFALRQVKIL